MNAIAQVSAAPVSGPKLDNRRVAAAIIDLLIVSVGAVAILVAGDALSGDRQSALTAVILGWSLYYFFALESGEGQTVGKKLMKIRVVLADGRPAGMREVAVRTVLRVVDNYLVGLIVMLATGEKRQRIGDLAAGTIVVDASGPMVAAAAPAAVAEPAAVEAVEAVEGVEAEEAEGDEETDAVVEDEPVATQTITLPSRPEPPATLADLTEPEAEVADEPVADDVADEPVAEEPVVEVDEPLAEEPVVEVEAEPVVEVDEPVAEEPVVEVEAEPVVEVDEPVAEEPVVEVEAEPVVEVDEPVAEEPVVEVEAEPVVEVDEAVAEEPVVEVEPVPVARVTEEPADEEPELPPVSSPVIEELADDVAAAHVDPVVEDQPEDDQPVNVKTVETVSPMDLIMGAADERAAESASESDQDAEDPASA